MRKFAVLTISAFIGLAFASTANANPGDTVQSWGASVAPLSQEQNSCDSNYSGPCVPIASDVDCEGGSGNGPAYVSGPVTVIGDDIYGLDSNDDGIGCEG